MGIVLDSSILIGLERRGGTVPTAWMQQEVGLAAMTAAELLAGLHRADPSRRARRAAFVEGILAVIPTLAFDLAAARLYAQVEADLASAGTPIGDHADLEIAATALARGWAVATLNRSDFARVPGLVLLGPENLENWG